MKPDKPTLALDPRPDLLVSVTAVVRNDGTIVEAFVEETIATLQRHFQHYELLLVDNGSSDDTDRRVQQLQTRLPNLRLIRLSRTYSAETALVAGLDNSIGDFVVTIDPRADTPAMIPSLLETAEGGYDVVIAEHDDADRQRSPVAGWLVRSAYGAASRILGYTINPSASHLRALSRRVVNSITSIKNKSRHFAYENVMVGFNQVYVPYNQARPPRTRSERFGLLKAIWPAINIVLSHSPMPLRSATLLGLIASLVSLLYLAYVFTVLVIKRQIIEGWITMSVMNTTLFFMLFVILTLLSEYVARILEETKNNPPYFIEYETSSSVPLYAGPASYAKLNVQ